MGSVLIVEDDRDVRAMMELFVSLTGHQPVTAENGQEGLAKMRACHPCAVLLDLNMPVMDGFEFRRHQMSDPALAPVPVLCVTAAYDPSRVSRTLHLPCIGKPVDLEDLGAKLAALCGEAQRTDTLDAASSSHNAGRPHPDISDSETISRDGC